MKKKKIVKKKKTLNQEQPSQQAPERDIMLKQPFDAVEGSVVSP